MKNNHTGSSFDDFLREEGIFDEVTEAARQRVASYDPGCCHKTRLRDAPCPLGRKCPYDVDAVSWQSTDHSQRFFQPN